ncbi:MAG: hypothetical protein BWY31_01980 [Lentisphaerae bacterium ADurb.Bin242]|nr:MAG: hypothetical protein BWY31_01980 [Lentisphaerae bacterium ADurb.Bin242]
MKNIPELDEKTCQILENLAIMGLTYEELAKAVGMSATTFRRRIVQKPGVTETLKNARELADGKVCASLYKRATGFMRGRTYFPPDTTACIFWLKTRQPERFREQKFQADVNANMKFPEFDVIIENQ